MSQKYTIGRILDTWVSAKGGRSISYEYVVVNKKYENVIPTEGKSYQLKKKYFVRFPKGHVDKGVLILERPAPDNIKEAPLDGWTLEELQEIYPEFKSE